MLLTTRPTPSMSATDDSASLFVVGVSVDLIADGVENAVIRKCQYFLADLPIETTVTLGRSDDRRAGEHNRDSDKN